MDDSSDNNHLGTNPRADYLEAPVIDHQEILGGSSKNDKPTTSNVSGRETTITAALRESSGDPETVLTKLAKLQHNPLVNLFSDCYTLQRRKRYV